MTAKRHNMPYVNKCIKQWPAFDKVLTVLSDGDKDSDGPSESGDNTSESTQGAPSEPAQEKGTHIYTMI